MTEDDLEIENSNNNQLQVIIKESELSNDKSSVLMSKFANFFSDADLWAKKAKTIKVTHESQKSMMDAARQGRLFLRKIRLDIESIRKSLKEESLREGRAIDKVAKILKEQIEPIEEYLDKQEHFIEYREAEKEAKVRAEIERKMEEERIAEEKRKAQEEERLRKENEALKAEQTRIQAEADAKIREAKAIAEKAEKELQNKKIAEMRAEAEAIRKAQELKSASDIVKINKLYCDLMAIEFPECVIQESKLIVFDSKSHIGIAVLKCKKYIESKHKNEEEI